MNAVLALSPTDGRWLRSIRTRAAIIESWLELLEAGDLLPTAKGVADRAGVGLRTVFQHFSDMNALHTAAGEEFTSRIMPNVVHVPADLPIAERIQLAAASSGRMFEEITSLRRACERQESLSEEIHGLISNWEAVGAASTRRIFEAEFSSAEPASREVLELTVDAVLSWSNWNQLRQRRGCSTTQSLAAVRHSLTALLCCC